MPGTIYQDHMKREDAFRLIEILKTIRVSEIDMLGGEPLLVPWMKDYIEAATSANMSVYLSTNGSLTENIKGLTNIRSELFHIGFSLHGFLETHNQSTRSRNYEKVIQGIKILLDAGKQPLVKSTATRENMHELPELVSFLRAFGIRSYYLMHEDLLGRKDYTHPISFPEFWNFFSCLKSNMEGLMDIEFVAASGFYKYGGSTPARCDAGRSKIAIMPDGSVFPCNLFARFGEFCLGNVFRDGIEKIWRSPGLEIFKRIYTVNSCTLLSCNHYLKCKGGCPAHNYYFYGSFSGADPRCIKNS
jgi:radical SAM protein with 4Fe4S-binding SPASM domain